MQFRTEADVAAALKLSGQALMGRDIEVHAAEEGGSAKLNLGAPVQDCWFCLSNSQVRAPARACIACALAPGDTTWPVGASVHWPPCRRSVLSLLTDSTSSGLACLQQLALQTAGAELQADVHLVADVGTHAYLAIDKGPISDVHALIVAVEHYPNLATLKPEAWMDVEGLMRGLQAAYKSRGLQLVGFERCARFDMIFECLA